MTTTSWYVCSWCGNKSKNPSTNLDPINIGPPVVEIPKGIVGKDFVWLMRELKAGING